MKYLNNIILVVFLLLFSCSVNSQVYTYNDVQGVWRYDRNTIYHDYTELWGKEYYIFMRNTFLCISTHNLCDYCVESRNIGLKQFGFTNAFSESSIEALCDSGKYITFVDEKNRFDSWCCFFVEQGESMDFFYHECSYLDRLPKKAQCVLFQESLHDHRNYAREFLEYDICGIKADSVQLLDSLRNPTNTIIYKDDIVVVRDTTGDLLQVEYELEPDKYVVGYLRKEDLQFVCNE